MKRPMLVRDRVTLASIAVLAVGLAAISLATNLLLTHQLKADASRALHDRAAAQLATLDTRGGTVRVRESDDETLDRQSWVYTGGRAIERPTGAADLQRVADSLAGVTKPTERSIGERVRLYATPAYAADGRRAGTVVVGLSLGPYEHSERIARVGTLALDALVLLLGGLVARRAVGAALRPVGDMAGRAADWSERDLHRRFDLGPPRDELTSLAATLDDLLGRIDAAMRHEQRFSAEVAHELRTPLSGLRGEAELALRREGLPRATRESLEAILVAADRMASAIETLLLTARGSGPPGSSDPAPAVHDVVESMRPASAAAGVDVVVREAAGPLRVGADRELVAQALAPLVENAIRHARGSVVVSTSRRNGQVAIAVEDDGPGVAAGQDQAVFEPGVSTSGSAGLGLPLARRLARSCGGDVVAATGGPGGGRFELVLPGTLSASA